MSLEIKVSRAEAMGDPGLFGSILKGIGGAVGGFISGGPLGAVSGAIRGIKGGKPRRRRPQILPARRGGRVRPGIGARMQQRRGPVRRQMFEGRISAFGPSVRMEEEFGPPGRNGAVGTKVACPSGFRPNKSSYFLRDGTFVPEGTKCVKIRRRNPLNPRALDRAIGRVSSAKKAAKKLGRITIRKKC